MDRDQRDQRQQHADGTVLVAPGGTLPPGRQHVGGRRCHRRALRKRHRRRQGVDGAAGLGGGACLTGAERTGRSAALTGCTLVNVAVRRRVGALTGALTGACTTVGATVGATTGFGAAGFGCGFAGAGVGGCANVPSTDGVGFGVGLRAGVHAAGAAAAEAVPIVVLATVVAAAGHAAGPVPPVAGAQGVPATPTGADVVPGAGLVPAVVVVPITVVAGTTTATAVVPQDLTTSGAGATTGVGDVGAAGPSMTPVGVVRGTETSSCC